MVSLPEVVESIKELAKLDGAIIVSEEGIVEAAGRHLDAGGARAKKFRGLGARHRAAMESRAGQGQWQWWSLKAPAK